VSDLAVDLAGRRALITGAGSGIGAAIAEYFAASGAQVALVDLVDTTESAALLGDGARAFRCDVADRASVEASVEAAESEMGPIDVLVNSAGVVRLAPTEELDDEAWDLTMDVNLKGTFLVSQALGRRMVERGDGCIINLASQAASVALPQHAAYCASKAGVIGLTRVLASEWGGRGVRVNAISPTVVLTPLGRDAWSGPKGEALLSQIPVGRFAEPVEIAALAAFLASRSSSMLNGADVVIDGGYTIR
jgi:NAD(P)-dependent dehydrogenase (short-subunit alcohol dehydrogenase family)